MLALSHRPVRQASFGRDAPGRVRAFDVLSIHAAQDGDDVKVDVTQVVFLGARLVVDLGVVRHEAIAQVFDCGCLAHIGLVAVRIAASADLGQPGLRQPSRLG